jgi:starch-binding outer membrane protein, SusD/RagB family
MTMHGSIGRWAMLAAIGVVAAGVTGCQDVLLEEPPNFLTADNLYRTPAGFEAGLNGLYALAREEHVGLAGGGNTGTRQMFTTVGVDNVAGKSGDGITNAVTALGLAMNPELDELRLMWNWLYATVNAANTLVVRGENPEIAWTEAQKNQAMGEARLLRAWAYRHLTGLWGDVPLTLDESSGANIRTDWQRAPVAEVRAQMEEDLLFAEANLPLTNGERLNRAVAQHYLSELYLWQERWANAEAKAEAVINSGAYQLVTERYGVKANEPGVAFMDQLLDGNVLRSQGNTEVLWPWQFEQSVAGGGGSAQRRSWVSDYDNIPGLALSVEHGGRGTGRARMTRWAMELYCVGDSQPENCLDPEHPKSRAPDDDRGSIFALRRFYIYNEPADLPAGKSLGDTLWLEVRNESLTARDQVTSRKWDCADPNQLSTQARCWPDNAYLRLAETYLLAAEAELQQGKLAEAAEHINALRRRAHASEIAPPEVTLAFILDERSRELFSEEHRRYTLVRTGTLLERVRAYNQISGPNIQEHNLLLPIPQAAIDANLTHDMRQNAGY